tara:strand:+ start:229 stop:483 length:255 start_codon:yes stop_codon:yes gene_type:complete
MDPAAVIVTAPVAPEIDIFVPATIDVTPVLAIVTAPVAEDTDIPVPATAEVTPVFVIVKVSVAVTAAVIPVPAVTITVFPSAIV